MALLNGENVCYMRYNGDSFCENILKKLSPSHCHVSLFPAFQQYISPPQQQFYVFFESIEILDLQSTISIINMLAVVFCTGVPEAGVRPELRLLFPAGSGARVCSFLAKLRRQSFVLQNTVKLW